MSYQEEQERLKEIQKKRDQLLVSTEKQATFNSLPFYFSLLPLLPPLNCNYCLKNDSIPIFLKFVSLKQLFSSLTHMAWLGNFLLIPRKYSPSFFSIANVCSEKTPIKPCFRKLTKVLSNKCVVNLKEK